MSSTTHRRIKWTAVLLAVPIVFLCIIVPMLAYERQIRDILRPPPFEVLGSPHGQIMPNGLWRVTFRFNVREQCGNVTWRKAFRFDAHDDLLLDAVNASRPQARGAVIAGGSSRPGPLDFWLEYEPIAGRSGVFLVSGAFIDCPSGYQSVLVLPPVPVDWTGVQP
jgi:hypothetical protein